MTDTSPIHLALQITNHYPDLGRVFHRTLVTSVTPPEADSSPDDLQEWAMEQLLAHTGEGEDYAETFGSYTVAVLASPDRPELVGLSITAEG